MADYKDLPLNENIATRLVPWIMGVVTYLVALALAATVILSIIANEWREGLEGALTVQIPFIEKKN